MCKNYARWRLYMRRKGKEKEMNNRAKENQFKDFQTRSVFILKMKNY